MKKAATKAEHPKKEFKKEIAGKLEIVLADLKDILGEEEFKSRLKKAAKTFTHGLHGKDILKQEAPVPKAKKVSPEIKQSPKKVKALKKAALKKAAASK